MHSFNHLLLLILLRSLHPFSVHQSWLHHQVILRNCLLHLFRLELLCLHHCLLLAPMLQINLRTPLLMLIHDLSIRLSRTDQPGCQRPMSHIRHLHLVSFQFLLFLIHLLQMILQMLMFLIHLLQVILIRLQFDLLSPRLLFLETLPQTLQKILIPLHLAWKFLFWKLQELNMFLRVLLSNIFIPCDDLFDFLSFRFISLLSLGFQA